MPERAVSKHARRLPSSPAASWRLQSPVGRAKVVARLPGQVAVAARVVAAEAKVEVVGSAAKVVLTVGAPKAEGWHHCTGCRH